MARSESAAYRSPAFPLPFPYLCLDYKSDLIGLPIDGKLESMKTTIDIPDEAFGVLMDLTQAETKREAILAAVEDFNRRHQVESVVASFGQWKMDTNDAIEAADVADAQ